MGGNRPAHLEPPAVRAGGEREPGVLPRPGGARRRIPEDHVHDHEHRVRGGQVRQGGGGQPLDDDKEQPDETTDKKLDRIAVLFEVCEIDDDGAFQVRPGWDWVDALSEGGAHRGLDKDNHTPTDECQAALTAHYNGGDYTVGDANGDNVKISEERFNGDINDIVRKFDIRTDGDWQAKTQQNTADLNAANQAVVTVNQQHGTASMGDVGAAVVFTLSGLVNLVIWGVILGLMRIACLFVACFLACAGVGLGALVLAFAPDKGRRALLNAFGRMVGMCAGVTVVGLVAAVGCIFFNAGMAVLGLLDNDGNTTGTVLSMSLASILLPLGYLWMVRDLCVTVWRIDLEIRYFILKR